MTVAALAARPGDEVRSRLRSMSGPCTWLDYGESGIVLAVPPGLNLAATYAALALD